jgi:hypothetical protein
MPDSNGDPEDYSVWPTSDLLDSFVRNILTPFMDESMREAIAVEIDLRIPPTLVQPVDLPPLPKIVTKVPIATRSMGDMAAALATITKGSPETLLNDAASDEQSDGSENAGN